MDTCSNQLIKITSLYEAVTLKDYNSEEASSTYLKTFNL